MSQNTPVKVYLPPDVLEYVEEFAARDRPRSLSNAIHCLLSRSMEQERRQQQQQQSAQAA